MQTQKQKFHESEVWLGRDGTSAAPGVEVKKNRSRQVESSKLPFLINLS